MKKDRNCNMYPTYPIGYMQPPMMSMEYVNPYMNMNQNNYYNNLSNQIRELERRISNLESLIGNTSSYNNSTYQMM